MDRHEQEDAFAIELDALIKRFNNEFDIGIYAMVGIIAEKQQDMLSMGTSVFDADEWFDDDDDDDADGGEENWQKV